MPALFLAKTGWDRPRKKKKNFSGNFVYTRPEQENSEKSCKKIQKIKKLHSNIIFSQNGMRLGEKGRKKFLSRIPFILDPGKKIPKIMAKKFKKLKNLIQAIFLAKTGWDRPGNWEKYFRPDFRLYWTPARKFRKNSKKIKKIKKHLAGIIFSRNGMR